MRDIARASLTRVALTSTSAPSPSCNRLARARLSDDVSRRLRDDVRAGKRPEFVDVASHVFTSGGARERFSRARAKRGWDWHAWQLFVALTPAMASYACVTQIQREYGPVFEEAMEKRERGRVEAIQRATAGREGEREADARALAERVATLERRVRGVESTVTERRAKETNAGAKETTTTRSVKTPVRTTTTTPESAR